jgi:ribosome biogenesis GTPase
MKSDSKNSHSPSSLSGLERLGWHPFFQAQYELGEFLPELIRARVASERKPHFLVRDGDGNNYLAELPGGLRFQIEEREDLPASGDWVLIEPRDGPKAAEARATIRHVFDRRSRLSRQAVEELRPQVIAANIDVALIVTSLNADLNLRRLERYLSIVWDSGARPIIVLSKSDLVSESSAALAQVEKIAPGVPVIVTSSVSEKGAVPLLGELKAGETHVLIGSSGVGKSSLLNRLMGADVMSTGAIRESDDKGRHTTTSRELFVSAEGAVFIDTPGMRELGLWSADDGLGQAFADIELLARECRFGDCKHETEPDCAIQAAIKAGTLDAERLQAFTRLLREAAHQARKLDPYQASKQKDQRKAVTKTQRARTKARERGDI